MSVLARQRLRGLVLDVDGTLLDTTFLHTVAWADALRQHGHVVAMARIHPTIGMGTDHLLEHLLGPDRDQAQDESIAGAHTALVAQHWNDLQPLPGARELLAAAGRRGLRVLLASSAGGAELEALLRALGDPDEVDVVTTSSDVERSKPDPDLVTEALHQAGLAPEDVVFVGDAVWDVQAAGELGIDVVAVTCGGTPAAQLREAGAVEVYDDPADLLEATAAAWSR